MSETFVLWNPICDEKHNVLSFFVTATNMQGLHQGTAEMVAHMLGDLGVAQIKFSKWEVGQFTATNWLVGLDEFQGEGDWGYFWQPTWPVMVTLTQPLSSPLPERTDTTAWDDTWGEGAEAFTESTDFAYSKFITLTVRVPDDAVADEVRKCVDGFSKKYPDTWRMPPSIDEGRGGFHFIRVAIRPESFEKDSARAHELLVALTKAGAFAHWRDAALAADDSDDELP